MRQSKKRHSLLVRPKRRAALQWLFNVEGRIRFNAAAGNADQAARKPPFGSCPRPARLAEPLRQVRSNVFGRRTFLAASA
ncbi:hypothetical protein [Mesorhizobium sp.]|uniref:hypothetical protein n=1 Tax=Mesorhizobium sp. TaxID=1871066 RepID=UPI000FEA7CFD|nr:hypothetical protein [Mesorhizobium sp.]RWK54686.1 MAG: hypothetical protein EOR48_15840 [Mesorhizobium sp.]TIP44334.1 MAG: hypothetical protein E5X62_15915 [Mesorhizobium sp.]